MRKTICLLATLLLLSSGSAFADYSFTYVSNDNSVMASGWLNATPYDGTVPLTVTGGSITITEGLIQVTASLYPGSGTSPAGMFYYDNQLNPGPVPNLSAMLTSGGLLFATASGPTEVNLYNWGNAGSAPQTDYELTLWSPATGYLASGATSDPGFAFDGKFTVASVPLPASAWIFGAGMIGLLCVGRKRLKN